MECVCVKKHYRYTPLIKAFAHRLQAHNLSARELWKFTTDEDSAGGS
jgi:hypothetical protein